jgi:hypothetical protein
MRKRLLRRLIVIGAAVVLLPGAALIGLVRYAQPSEALDLRYERYDLRHELAEMIRERRTSIVLSEAEINNLLKAELAERPVGTPYARLTGARFELVDGGLTAHLKLSVLDRADVGVRLSYALRWEEPNLIVQLQEARIKSVPIPAEWIPATNMAIRLTDRLPPFIGIRSVEINEDAVVIRFKLVL